MTSNLLPITAEMSAIERELLEAGVIENVTTVPATREAAIARLVELDVARWGEGERAAAHKLHSTNCPTYGLALNSLAHRPEYDFGEGAPELVAAATAALTDEDWRVLRRGG